MATKTRDNVQLETESELISSIEYCNFSDLEKYFMPNFKDKLNGIIMVCYGTFEMKSTEIRSKQIQVSSYLSEINRFYNRFDDLDVCVEEIREIKRILPLFTKQVSRFMSLSKIKPSQREDYFEKNIEKKHVDDLAENYDSYVRILEKNLRYTGKTIDDCLEKYWKRQRKI